jgi:DNA-binding NarL/FixJ family response regulator
MKIKIAIVEDQRETLNSLTTLLNNSDVLEVIGSFSSGEEALSSIPKIAPDVNMIDIGLPGISGIEVIKEVKEKMPTLEMLVLTVYEDKKHLFAALKAGASGYLLKDSNPEEIIKAVKDIRNGNAPMSPKIARYVIEYFHQYKSVVNGIKNYNLSQRAKEILKGLADAFTYKKIANKLFISPHTVRTHIKNIYEKLHVHSRMEAVSKARIERIV